MEPLAPRRQALLRIREREDVGALRRSVGTLAIALGASEVERGRAELAATELATNLLFHAKALGYALVQALDRDSRRGLEIVAVDRGPGIRDVEAVLRAPSRTQIEARLASGSPREPGLGCGLSSVRRLASEFDIHTSVGAGTVVLARFLFGAPDRAGVGAALRWGAVSLPVVPDDENGDAWAFVQDSAGGSLLVVDGLGHGRHAAVASAAAVAEFHRSYGGDIDAYFRNAHGATRATRGVAALLCRLEQHSRSLSFAGLGNVEGRIHSASGDCGLMSRNGTLGMNLAPTAITVRELAWGPGATLVVHSDGLRSSAARDGDRGLWRRDPAVIAAVLHRDLARERDDATVVVVQDAGGDADSRAAPETT